MTITEDDLLRALEGAQQANEDVPGATREELCLATGMGKNRIGDRLKLLAREGRLVVRKRPATNLAGQTYYIPVYSIKK